MPKHFIVSGGNLAAAICSTKLLLEGHKVSLCLPEEKHLVPAWKSCEFESVRTNNGFHALDVTRAPGLVHLLGVELALDLDLDSRPSGLLLNGSLLDANDAGTFWNFAEPLAHPAFMTIDEMDNSLGFGERFFLQSLSTRYGDSWRNERDLMIPWFLPKEFLLNSNDEGDRYRNLLRAGFAIPQRVVPASGLFSDLANHWLDQLVGLGVRLEAEPLRKNNVSTATGLRSFFLTVFSARTELFDAYAEILVAWEQAEEISRISAIKKDGELNYLLIESHHLPGGTPDLEMWQSLLETLGDTGLKLIGSAQTRTIFGRTNGRPGPPFVMEVRNDRSVNVKFPAHGPINMAKVYENAMLAMRDERVHQ